MKYYFEATLRLIAYPTCYTVRMTHSRISALWLEQSVTKLNTFQEAIATLLVQYVRFLGQTLDIFELLPVRDAVFHYSRDNLVSLFRNS